MKKLMVNKPSPDQGDKPKFKPGYDGAKYSNEDRSKHKSEDKKPSTPKTNP
jgi:hypothetical protein